MIHLHHFPCDCEESLYSQASVPSSAKWWGGAGCPLGPHSSDHLFSEGRWQVVLGEVCLAPGAGGQLSGSDAVTDLGGPGCFGQRAFLVP